MRSARVRIDSQATWYHCYNRICGTREDLPFGDLEKAQFVRVLRKVSRLYSVRIVAYQVMSNHFHLLVQAPSQTPGPEEMCRRYKAFHRGLRTIEPDSPACRIWQERSRDISWFMRHLQQIFTIWYNRSRPIRRRGPLWTDRFKHSLLESGSAVWACWTYIENNARRAGLVREAGDYRYGSYGVWRQSGRHPFEEQVMEAGWPMLQESLGISSWTDLREAMDHALGAGASSVSAAAGRRVRYWTQGLVIGSRLYLSWVMSHYRSAPAVRRHRSSRMDLSGASAIYAWRRLRSVEGI
ncbi:MAG: transposase [Candidatus Eisenbacteria bacterium]|nr:transposase [Candidatus Eisenbacteria bacterium]